MEEIEFILLWSDALVFVLLALICILFWVARNNRQWVEPWKRLFHRPLYLIAFMVLCVYGLIGFLDSIHFQLSFDQRKSEIHSALDVILMPLPLQHESSYSAPFASHLFTKENKILADNTLVRVQPRLEFGASHLEQLSDKEADIRYRILQGMIQGLILSSALWILFALAHNQNRKIPWEQFSSKMCAGQLSFPWKSFWCALFILFSLVLVLKNLFPYYHIMGTSKVGEDVFYQSMKSIRTGLIIGSITTLVMLPFALILGILAGYFRGWVDDIIQYIYTTLSSIPGVLLIAAAVLTLQVAMGRHEEWFQTAIERSEARLLALCAILGVTSWTGLCRLLRAETLKIREMDYILAAKSVGVGHFKLLHSHVLPNVLHIILIALALDFSGLVLAEAVLSYVGVGVDPTTYSWGIMINGARLEMARVPVVWWSLLSAFGFMFILVLCANIFSDALREAYDPRVTSHHRDGL